MECKVLKKCVTYPQGVSSEATRRGVFGHWRHSTYKIDSPGGLWAHPPRVGYAFFQYLALQECPRNAPVWATLAQNGQKTLKKGVPPVLTSFSVWYQAARPCCRRNLKKSGEPPPAGPSGGGHFFPGFGGYMVFVAGTFPGSCFLEGGPV